MNQPDDTYNVIFYYDQSPLAKYVVNFVEAGTEKSGNPFLVKTLTVEADQTVVTPQSRLPQIWLRWAMRWSIKMVTNIRR